MTFDDASRLTLILTMNYGAFMPLDPGSAAIKKGIWIETFRKFDMEAAMPAIEKMLKELKFPPTISDFYEFMGLTKAEKDRAEVIARLTGPTVDDQDGVDALYTADMDRVNRIMLELDKELSGLGGA